LQDKQKDNTKSRETDRAGISGKKMMLALVLFIAALLLGYYFFSGSKSDEIHHEVNGVLPQPAEVVAGIDSVLKVFGIESKWVIDGKDNLKKAKTSSQLWFSKEVKLPPDLPAMNVNLGLTSFLTDKNLKVKTVEDPRTKNLTIDVLNSGDSLRGKIGEIRLSYSDSVKRKTTDVCIILDSLEYLSIADAEKILDSGEEFSVMMPLRNDKADYQSIITDRKRDFLIELTYGNEESFEADFRDGMNQKEWRSKIRSLCLSFPSASGIIISGKDLSSEFGKNITEEFEKFGQKVFADTSFSSASYESAKADNIISDINSKNNSGIRNILMITSLNFSEFEELIRKTQPLRLKGYRFSDFGDITRKTAQVSKADSTSASSVKIQKKK